jgi:hypothetical protein
MTPHLGKIVGYQSFAAPVPVAIGDSTELEAIGSGSVMLRVDQENGDVQLNLSEVWYVPKLGCNLMSVKYLTQAGASVAFTESDCIIKKAGVRIKVPVDRLLYFLIEKVQPTATATQGHAHESSCGPFPKSSSRQVNTKLDLVHMVVCGPLPESSLGGSRYVATFLDEYSQLSVVCHVAYKSEVEDTVQQVLIMLEVQSGCKVKVVRTDRGGEYINHSLSQWFKSEGIIHEITAPYTPQQNGAAERLNRTLFDKVRAMLFDSKLSRKLWAEAVVTTNYDTSFG